MFFVLGVLVATLVALTVLPAVWNRAVRLTTRRIEAAVPVSLFEIQAAKDQQRAQLALAQRRVEIHRDRLVEQVAGNAGELETRRLRIVELERSLADLQAAHDTLAERLAIEEAAHRERTEERDITRTNLAAREAELAARTGELQDTRAALERTRGDLATQTARGDTLDTVLAARDATIAEQVAAIAHLRSEEARLSTELAEALSRGAQLSEDLATERKMHADLRAATDAERTHLEAELARLRHALDAARSMADQRGGRITVLEQDLTETSARLAAAKADLLATQSVSRAAEAKRAEEFAAAEADARRLTEELTMVRADHSMMEGALAKARAERDALAARDSDLAVLRERLSDVAARILAQAVPSEPGLPDTSAAVSDPPSLADRIRAVRQENAATEAALPAAEAVPAKLPAGRRTAKR